MSSDRSAAILALLLALGGCGAKTGLEIGDGGSDAATAPDGARPRDARIDSASDEPDTGPPEVRCAESDFVFTVPYREAPDPERGDADVTVGVRFLDVYVLFDITGSMTREILTMRDAAADVLGGLRCRARPGSLCSRDRECPAGSVCDGERCVDDPGTSGCVVDLWSGAGSYAELYEHHLHIQPDASRTAAAIPTDTYGGTEQLYRTLSWVAEPPAGEDLGCSTDGIGCPGFREDAARVVLAFTDEGDDGATTLEDAGDALLRQEILLAGIWSGTPGHHERHDLEALAVASGATVDGVPLVFDGADLRVVDAVTEALRAAIRSRRSFIRGDVEDVEGDAGDARELVDYVEVDVTTEGCLRGEPTMDRDADGRADAIEAPAGSRVCFDVVPRVNTTVPPADETLIFLGRLVIRSGASLLAERSLCFAVPPTALGP